MARHGKQFWTHAAIVAKGCGSKPSKQLKLAANLDVSHPEVVDVCEWTVCHGIAVVAAWFADCHGGEFFV